MTSYYTNHRTWLHLRYPDVPKDGSGTKTYPVYILQRYYLQSMILPVDIRGSAPTGSRPWNILVRGMQHDDTSYHTSGTATAPPVTLALSYHMYQIPGTRQCICQYLVYDFMPDHHHGGPEIATKTTIQIGVKRLLQCEQCERRAAQGDHVAAVPYDSLHL